MRVGGQEGKLPRGQGLKGRKMRNKWPEMLNLCNFMSSYILLFYYLTLQQKNALRMSLCMQLHFRGREVNTVETRVCYLWLKSNKKAVCNYFMAHNILHLFYQLSPGEHFLAQQRIFVCPVCIKTFWN